MNKVVLSCLLLLLAGCVSKQDSRSSYLFENITPTCAYNTLEEMDGITKVWIYYDRLPGFGLSHLSPEDGIGFEGEGFFGSVSMRSSGLPSPRNFSVNVVVYSDDGFLYRHFAIWGPRERLLRIQQIKEQIKEGLSDSCNE